MTPTEHGLIGDAPDPSTVDWKAACERLYAAGHRVPIKQHDRTAEQQEAVEDFTQAMVEVGEVLHGPELGLMGLPVEPLRFLTPVGAAEKLRAALRWYADSCNPEMHRNGFGDVRHAIAQDKGQRARDALDETQRGAQ